MVEQAHDLKTPIIEAEQHSYAGIIDPGLLGSVHGIKAPPVMALDGIGRVHFPVGFVVIGFLEYLVSTDSCFLELGKLFPGKRGTIYIGSSDGPMLCFDAVDLTYRITNKINFGLGGFTVHQDRSFLTLFDHDADFPLDFIHGKGLTVHESITAAEAAVFTVVGTFIANIEGGEKDDAVPVYVLL
jgi:hypothetical protein